MNWAVIPARGGSKRIPRKNIRPFCGKPMIAWVIEELQRSGCFERIIVSTDDQEIADISARLGANVPFVRPADLSDDMTGTTDVIAHAVEWALENGHSLDYVTCAYATAPFLRSEDIQLGHEKMRLGGWDYVFSATAFASPIERAFRLEADQSVAMDNPEMFPVRSQDLRPAYHDAAQFYVGRPEAWRERRKLFYQRSSAVVLPSWRVQDIDTMEDWQRAELMFESLGFQVRDDR